LVTFPAGVTFIPLQKSSKKKIIGMRPFGHLLINKIQKEKQQQAQKEALQT